MPWTFGEPAFANTFTLLKNFQYAPERGECNYSQDSGKYKPLD